MVAQPICEPVGLPLGINVLVARVSVAASAPPPSRLLHFHDVAEIVLFGETRGRFECGSSRFAIVPGCAVFAPSMHYHDFEFYDGPKNWTLIQVDPYVLDQITTVEVPSTPLCVHPTAAGRARLAMLSDWLVDVSTANPADPLIDQIVALIMHSLCVAPRETPDEQPGRSVELARFLPVIEQLRAAPGQPLPLKDAATLCHLSPAYFSRRFSAVFGCSYTDYAMAFRLHVAARKIATTGLQLSEIGYALGFASPSHFAARFHERFGISPREYRHRIAGTG